MNRDLLFFGLGVVLSFVYSNCFSQFGFQTQLQPITCAGSNNGSIQVFPYGADMPFSYQWSSGQTNSLISGLGSGVYSVTVQSGPAFMPFFSWNYSNTGLNHTLLVDISGIDLNGSNAQPGDVLGVFYADSLSGQLHCGGYRELDGSNYVALSAWGAVSVSDGFYSANFAGFVAGSPFYWKLWKSSTKQVIPLLPTYLSNLNGLILPSVGSYMTNGISALGSLVEFLPVVSGSFSLSSPTPLLISTQTSPQTHCLNPNGVAHCSISGGISPYFVSWGNGVTGLFRQNLIAGNYQFTVTDSLGCSVDTHVVVGEPYYPSLALDYEPITCFGSSTTVGVNATGGFPPYQGTGSFLLTGGFHEMVVTDSRGCSSVDTVFLSQPPPLGWNVVMDSIPCFGGTTGVTLLISGGTPPYQGGGFLGVFGAGTHAVLIFDSHGCQSLVQFGIGQPDSISPQAYIPPIHCFGDSSSVEISAYGGTPPFGGTGLYRLVSGVHHVSVTDAHGCQSILYFSIPSPPSLHVHVNVSSIACHGGTGLVQVGASGGTPPYSGVFSGQIGSGNHTFSIVDSRNCLASQEVLISEPSPLEVVINQTQPVCYGQPGILEIHCLGGSPPYSGLFSGEIPGGTYFFHPEDSHGCGQDTTITISQPDPLGLAFQVENNPCPGEPWVLVVSAFGGTPPYLGTGLIELAGGGPEVLLVKDAHLCQVDSLVEFISPEPFGIVASVSNSGCPSCPDGSVQVTGFGAGPFDYFWSNGSTDSFLEGLVSDGYGLHLTDSRGCSLDTILEVLATFEEQWFFLHPGWNFMCTRLDPADFALASVFSDSLCQYLIKSENGALFWPCFGLQQVVEFDGGECYQVFCIEPRMLRVIGAPLNMTGFELFLEAGWNFFPYLGSMPADPMIVLAEILDATYAVKNETGEVAFPDMGINSIGDFLPGKAYQICMKTPVVFYLAAD